MPDTTASFQCLSVQNACCPHMALQVSRAAVLPEQEANCRAQVGAVGDLLARALYRPVQLRARGGGPALVALQCQLHQVPDWRRHLVNLQPFIQHVLMRIAPLSWRSAGFPCLYRPARSASMFTWSPHMRRLVQHARPHPLESCSGPAHTSQQAVRRKDNYTRGGVGNRSAPCARRLRRARARSRRGRPRAPGRPGTAPAGWAARPRPRAPSGG